MGGDQQVIRANQSAASLKMAADVRIVGRCFLGELQNFSEAKKGVERDGSSWRRRGDISTPYRSSALVMTETHTSLTGVFLSRSRKDITGYVS